MDFIESVKSWMWDAVDKLAAYDHEKASSASAVAVRETESSVRDDAPARGGEPDWHNDFGQRCDYQNPAESFGFQSNDWSSGGGWSSGSGW